MLQISDYQELVEQVALYPGVNENNMQAAMYLALGLNGEAGEVAEKIKKLIRDQRLLPEAKLLQMGSEKQKEILNELGDVLWYITRLALEMGFDLEDVMAANHAKLSSRYRRGKLGGSGDNR